MGRDFQNIKLRRSQSSDYLSEATLVHTPIRKEHTIRKVPSVPDLRQTAGSIHSRYAPRQSFYHYYRDYDIYDDYWGERRSNYTPTQWPYQHFAGRRYAMMDGSPYSIYWNFAGLNNSSGDVMYSGLASRRASMARPLWSYRHNDYIHKPWNFSHMDTKLATQLYRSGIMDFDSLEKRWLTPSYEARRGKQCAESYDPSLFPKYVKSY